MNWLPVIYQEMEEYRMGFGFLFPLLYSTFWMGERGESEEFLIFEIFWDITEYITCMTWL